jgi:hypothetical protein
MHALRARAPLVSLMLAKHRWYKQQRNERVRDVLTFRNTVTTELYMLLLVLSYTSKRRSNQFIRIKVLTSKDAVDSSPKDCVLC